MGNNKKIELSTLHFNYYPFFPSSFFLQRGAPWFSCADRPSLWFLCLSPSGGMLYVLSAATDDADSQAVFPSADAAGDGLV
jgi:hypothetical protein